MRIRRRWAIGLPVLASIAVVAALAVVLPFSNTEPPRVVAGIQDSTGVVRWTGSLELAGEPIRFAAVGASSSNTIVLTGTTQDGPAIAAVSAATGEQIWSAATSSDQILASGGVVVAASDHPGGSGAQLIGLDARSGGEIWRGDEVVYDWGELAPGLIGGSRFANGRFESFAIALQTGATQWSVGRAGAAAVFPLRNGLAGAFDTAPDGTSLVARDVTNGREQWTSRPFEEPSVLRPALGQAAPTVALVRDGRQLYAFETDAGRQLWNVDTVPREGAIQFSGTDRLALCGPQKVLVVDLTTGADWEVQLNQGRRAVAVTSTALITATGSACFTNVHSGPYEALDLADGSLLWSEADPGARLALPPSTTTPPAAGLVLADGSIFSLDLETWAAQQIGTAQPTATLLATTSGVFQIKSSAEMSQLLDADGSALLEHPAGVVAVVPAAGLTLVAFEDGTLSALA